MMNRSKLIMMNRKKIILVFTAIAALILISGSYYILSQKQVEPEFAEENLTICYATLYSGLIPVAEAQDFFFQEGLNVTLRRLPTGKAALESMLNDECDFATTTEMPVVFYTFDRNDFSIFATIGTSDNFTKIIARNDREIYEPNDLEGKRIGTQKGTFSHYFFHVFSIKNNIPENNVTIVFDRAEELPRLLAEGEIDAFSMGEPHISNAKKLMGEEYVIFADPFLSEVTIDILALNSYIKDKPQVINATIKALLRAEEYIDIHHNETIKTLSRHYGVDESEISILIENNEMKISLDQYILYLLEDEARWLIQTNQTNNSAAPNFIDFIYVDTLKELKPQAVTIIR